MMDRRRTTEGDTSTTTTTTSATTTVTMRRPMSAPRPNNNDVTAIPRIVLDDRGGGGSGSGGETNMGKPGSSIVPSNGPGTALNPGPRGAESSDHGVPHRCHSDVGLPPSSSSAPGAPSLTMAMTLGENAGGDKLGVYCSPRTTRRSVDLDVGSRDPCRDYDWLEDRTSSLRVLSAGSRVGSAISLNSVCTAHSVGLLSNDSSDDFQDSSLHDGSVTGLPPLPSERERTGPLRRLQSYPEEDKGDNSDTGVTPRTSHSLCNLRAVQTPDPHHEQLTPEKLCLLPSDLDECEDRVPPPGEGRGDKKDAKGGGGAKQRRAGREGGTVEVSGRSHMVSYGKSSNSMREGRIRRWLEDMDKVSQ